MEKSTCYWKNKVKISFQFPSPSENDTQIKKEVLEILRFALQEQLQKADEES